MLCHSARFRASLPSRKLSVNKNVEICPFPLWKAADFFMSGLEKPAITGFLTGTPVENTVENVDNSLYRLLKLVQNRA